MKKDHFSSQYNPEQSETEIGNYPALKEVCCHGTELEFKRKVCVFLGMRVKTDELCKWIAHHIGGLASEFFTALLWSVQEPWAMSTHAKEREKLWQTAYIFV